MSKSILARIHKDMKSLIENIAEEEDISEVMASKLIAGGRKKNERIFGF